MDTGRPAMSPKTHRFQEKGGHPHTGAPTHSRDNYFLFFGLGLVASETAFADSSAETPGGVAGAGSPPPHPTHIPATQAQKTVTKQLEHHGVAERITSPRHA